MSSLNMVGKGLFPRAPELRGIKILLPRANAEADKVKSLSFKEFSGLSNLMSQERRRAP